MISYGYCAQIDNGVVVNTIVCNNVDWAIQSFGGLWKPVYDNNLCGVGWIWDGEKFNPPELEEE